MSTIKARVIIKGTRPILFHHFTVEAISLTKRERGGKAGIEPDEWKRTVLAMPETNQLYIEPTYIFGCLREGGKYMKSGKGTFLSKVASTLMVLDEYILLDRYLPPENELLKAAKTDPVYLDVRPVRNPTTRGRNVRYRVAASTGWMASFTIEWDNTIISRDQMQAIVTDAGKFAGLGDGRSISFGRFMLEEFSVIK